MSEAAKGPDGVAAAAFRALDAERWDEFVGWLDPEAVEEFRAGQLRFWKEAGERRPLTTADVRRMQPDMPPEIVEYHVKQWQSSDHGHSSIASYFADVASLEALEGLSGRAMLVRRLARLSPKAKLEDALGNLTDDAGLAEVDPRDLVPRRRVIGAVLEGDSIAHVVYRVQFGPDVDAEPPGLL
ncbi:MAG TPA: hypothetical protein VFZ18_11775, partial [Longimicrobiaceae bacterium]